MQHAIQRASVPNATAWSVTLTANTININNNRNENSNQDSSNLNDVNHNHILPAKVLCNPADASMYFDALLTNSISSNHMSIMSAGGIIGLLALPSIYFQSFREDDYMMLMESDTDDTVSHKTLADHAYLYLKAVSKHCNVVCECWQAHNQPDNSHKLTTISDNNDSNPICDMVPIQYLMEIFEAVSCCASICHDHSNRAHISSSGILNTLAKLATGKDLSYILLKHRYNHMKTEQGENNHPSCKHDSATISSPPNKKTNRNSFMNTNVSSSSTSTGNDRNSDHQDTKIHNHALTVAHKTFLQCCILASQYHLAAKVVQFYPVYDLPEISSVTHNGSNHTMMTSCETFLLYYYYLGMIHIGNNSDYRAAISAFQICISAVPAKEISAIVIAAYKKYLLCQCCLAAQDLEDDNLFFDDQDNVNNNFVNMNENKHHDEFLHDNENSKISPPKKLKNTNKSDGSTEFGINNIEHDNDNRKDRKRSKLSRPVPLQGALASQILKIPDFLCVEVSSFFSEAARSQYRKDFNKSDKTLQTDDLDPSNGYRITAMIEKEENTVCSKSDREKFEKNYYGVPHYHDIVATFCSFEISSFQTILNRDKSLLGVDGNFGLAKQLENIMKRIIVRRLANIYSVIKLETLAQSLGLYDDKNGSATMKAERFLLALAWKDQEPESQAGLINHLLSVPFDFRVDAEKSLVYFPKENDDYVESANSNTFLEANIPNLQSLLTDRVMSVMALADRVKHLDATLVASARYQTVVSKHLNNKNDCGKNSCGGGIVSTNTSDGPHGVTDLA